MSRHIDRLIGRQTDRQKEGWTGGWIIGDQCQEFIAHDTIFLHIPLTVDCFYVREISDYRLSISGLSQCFPLYAKILKCFVIAFIAILLCSLWIFDINRKWYHITQRQGSRYRQKYEAMTSDSHSCYLSSRRWNIRRERR